MLYFKEKDLFNFFIRFISFAPMNTKRYANTSK